MKRLLLFILLGLMAGVIFTQIYDEFMDPGANCFARAAEKTDAWNEKLRCESAEPCFVFAGGSEVRMCLDPRLMKDEFGVRVINAGGAAGFGVRCNAVLGVDYLRPGDWLVVSFRDTRLGENCGMTTDGIKFCWRRLGWRMFDTPIIPMTRDTLSHVLRGRSADLSMYATKKMVSPDKMFKYDTNTVLHESGWIENFYTLKDGVFRQFFGHNRHIDSYVEWDDHMLLFLRQLQDACAARGARLAIFLFPEASYENARTFSAIIAYQFVAAGIPVVKEPTFGRFSNQEYFADLTCHLSPQGVRFFSRSLAGALAQPHPFWTLSELESYIRAHGYEPSGRKISP